MDDQHSRSQISGLVDEVGLKQYHDRMAQTALDKTNW